MAEENHNNNDYIWLFHRNKEVKTISQFIEKEYIYQITPEEFFDLNRDVIFQQMTDEDKKEEKNKTGKYPESSNDINVNTTLPCPCKLKINPSKVTAEIAINQTNYQTESSDFYAFAYDKIQEIFHNEGYKIGTTTKRNLDCQVFGWFKSLYAVGLSSLENNRVHLGKDWSEFADLSRHVTSLATTVTANGGSFVIRLPIINASNSGVTSMYEMKGEKDWAGQWGRGSKDRNVYSNDTGEYYAKSSFESLASNYYNWLISSNDLIFISFEKLDMEKRRNEKVTNSDEDNFDIQTAISEGIYDMIGLVDDVTVVSDAASENAYVEVSGRDLMKLLIEDGSFFFNPSVTSDPSAVFANEQSYGKQGDIREADVLHNTYNNPINRLRRITGEIDVFSNRINMEIGYILKGVISQLANVEIVPGYVFDSWGDNRTKFIELEPKTEE